MPTLAETVTWAAYESEIRSRTGVPSGSDTQLQAYLDDAVTTADAYLANPFDGTDTLSPETVPAGVIEGVLVYLATAWEAKDEAGSAGVTSVKTRDLSETYGPGGYSPQGAALAAAKRWWAPWRRAVWR